MKVPTCESALQCNTSTKLPELLAQNFLPPETAAETAAWKLNVATDLAFASSAGRHTSGSIVRAGPRPSYNSGRTCLG